MSTDYDAIVVGARCGGSPTAMLLARNGYRVLLVDKATFPSDTMSTHLAHPPAVAALDRWGILEQLEATNCPPITRYSFDFGPVAIAGTPRPSNGIAKAYCPRRIVLDALLVEAAAAAGAEVREAFTVEEVADRRRACDGHPGPRQGRRHGDRDGQGRGRGGRQALAPGEGRAARAVQRGAGAGARLLRVLERPARRRLRHLHPRRVRPRLGGHTDARRPHLRGAGLAAGRVRGQPQGRGGHLHEVFELAPEFAERIKARSGSRASWARETFRATSASRTAPDGRSSETPATTSTRSRRSGSRMPSATPRRWPRALDETFAERRPFDDAMADYQRARDEEALPDLRIHLRLREARAASARDAAAHRGDAGQPGGAWTAS